MPEQILKSLSDYFSMPVCISMVYYTMSSWSSLSTSSPASHFLDLRSNYNAKDAVGDMIGQLRTSLDCFPKAIPENSCFDKVQ